MGSIMFGHSEGEGKWGVWRIEESIDELKAMLSKEEDLAVHSPKKENPSKWSQRLAVRALLRELDPRTPNIRYDGRIPIIGNGEERISITHDPEYVGIHLTPFGKPAGIDIQCRKPRKLERVAERFLNNKELDEVRRFSERERSDLLNILWCSKEALYKACNSSLRDRIRVKTERPSDQGRIEGEVLSPEGKRLFFLLEYRRLGCHHIAHILDGDFV